MEEKKRQAEVEDGEAEARNIWRQVRRIVLEIYENKNVGRLKC